MKELNYIEIAQALEKNELDSLPSKEERVFVNIWTTSANFQYDNQNQATVKSKLMEAIEPQATKYFQIPRIWYAAASFLLVCLVTVLFFLQNGSKTYITQAGESIEIELKDHTKVTLAGGSQLIVEKSFNKASRNITLDGTAFFKVAKNKNLPFIIATNKAEVKVLGTAFLVQARKASNYFQVGVQEGKVLVKTPVQSIVLEKGMSTYLNNDNQRLIVQNTTGLDPNNITTLTFVNANLADVLEEISKKYGVKFSYDQTLNTSKITLKTKSDNAEEIASILSETVGSVITVCK